MTTTTVSTCRVRIVDDIRGKTIDVDSQRDRADVWLDLVKLVHQVNRRRDDALRGCVHLRQDVIVLRWFCPWIHATECASQLFELAEPVHEAKKLIEKGGPQA